MLFEGSQFLLADANLTAKATKFVAHILKTIRFTDAAFVVIDDQLQTLA